MDKLKQIMVVDDDPISSVIVKKLSELTGFAEEVVSFISAVDGLDYLQQVADQKQEPPVLIFLDIRMPIVNGWDFLERFRKINQHDYFSNTSIYMLTSSSEQSDINKAKKYKMVTDYLVKPLSPEKLSTIRQKHLQPAENL